MRKIVLTYGLISGAVLSLMLLLQVHFFLDEIGFDKGMIVGYTSMVLAFLLIYFGVRTYRDELAGGRVTFWQAFKVGLLIMVIASACYVVTWELTFFFHNGEQFMEKYTAYALEKARAAGATEAQVAEKAREMAAFNVQYRNPLVNAALTFLEPLPVGLLLTLVSAGLLSRRRRVEEALAT
jgi:hypothetical protein